MKRCIGVLSVGLFFAAAVYAADGVKEGQWSVTVTTAMSGLPAGVPIPQPAPMTNTSCITKDHLVPNPGKTPQGCSPEQIQTDGNTVTYQTTCSRNGAEIVTKGQITYSGDSMQGNSTTNETVQGMHITSNMTMTGHYVGPCN